LNVKSKVALNLGAFLKSQKVTISYVMSVDPNGTTRLKMDTFSLILYLRIFGNLWRKFMFH